MIAFWPKMALIIGVFGVVHGLVGPGLIWLERKVCADIQNRIGPNRVGPYGLLQPIADGIKLIFKENIIPGHVDKVLYHLGPFFAYLPVALVLPLIPFGAPVGDMKMQIADLNIGIIFVLAVVSAEVYGIAFGAWASRNKYALMGGVRATAQMISYEVAMGLAIVSVLMTTGTTSLWDTAMGQMGTLPGTNGWLPDWNLFYQPVVFVIFMVCIFAETHRAPFDLPEAETELIAGYHIEYSSMHFALFFLGEYIAMVVWSALAVTLFFGGWDIHGFGWLFDSYNWVLGSVSLDGEWATSIFTMGIFSGKVVALLYFFMWVRWSLPRFRYDQLMDLGWRLLIPLALLNILATGFIWYFFIGGGM